MVADKGAPGLVPTRHLTAWHHLAADGAGGVIDTRLGGEFFGNPVLAPLGMIPRHAPDEGDVLPGDGGSADLAGARPATPERLEASAVPGEYGLEFGEDERAGPVRPEPAKGDPEDPIARSQSGTPPSR
jgi:hypothetical protein